MLIHHVAIEYNTCVFVLLLFIFHLHRLFVVGVVTIRWRPIYVNMMVKINQPGVNFAPVGKVLGQVNCPRFFSVS
nr:MAG TPA: hypothetical protein [Caudoviricetes sp.]